MRTEVRSQKSEVRSHSLACGRSGFSLVEVTLAMAVMAVGLIAILGLIPQGVTSSRSAADNTVAATIIHDDLNVLRRDALAAGGWPPLSVQQDICYDVAATNAVLCTSAGAYYHERFTPLTPGDLNVCVIQAVIFWPAQSASPLNSVTNFTKIARYQ